MERYRVSVGPETQYYEDINSPWLVYRFNANPIKTPTGFLLQTDNLNLKFSWKCKGLRIGKTTEKGQREAKSTDFEPHHKATVTRTGVLVPKWTNRPSEQDKESRNRPTCVRSTDLWCSIKVINSGGRGQRHWVSCAELRPRTKINTSGL